MQRLVNICDSRRDASMLMLNRTIILPCDPQRRQ
jgi:hypothetical protein